MRRLKAPQLIELQGKEKNKVGFGWTWLPVRAAYFCAPVDGAGSKICSFLDFTTVRIVLGEEFFYHGFYRFVFHSFRRFYDSKNDPEKFLSSFLFKTPFSLSILEDRWVLFFVFCIHSFGNCCPAW